MSQNYCDSSLFVLENILKIDAFSESVSENVPQRVPVNSNSERESSAGIVDREIYLKSASNSVDAVGIFKANNHIIVKAGSKISSVNHLPNQRGMQSMDKKRRELIDCGFIRDFTFACDCDFTSVSMPATIILGRSANGWTEWKDSAGDVIDKYRNTLE